MRPLCWPLLSGLVGCFTDPATPTFVAPLDGQTGVAVDAPLQVHLGTIGLPADAAIPPELVQVVDTETDGFVSGTLIRGAGTDVLFVPDEGWQPDHRYLWSVQQPALRARQPELTIAESLQGEASFATTHGPELLDAVVADDGLLCLLFSEPLAPTVTVDELTIGDETWEQPTLQLQQPQEADPTLELLAEDRGVAAACIDIEVQPGATLRATVGGDGPWQVEVGDLDLLDIVRVRHRRRP